MPNMKYTTWTVEVEYVPTRKECVVHYLHNRVEEDCTIYSVYYFKNMGEDIAAWCSKSNLE